MSCRNTLRPLRRHLPGLILATFTAFIAACGGGGGGGDDDPVFAGGSSGGATTSNVQPISVTGGPVNGVNLLMTSVTICTPGSGSQCQTIDNILVDTGSYGLRVMASVLNGAATPTTVRTANTPLVQCAQFADGFTWGSVKRADVRIAGEVASNIPIQIVGDSTFPTVPAACQSTGDNNSSVAAFGANGVLGIGVFADDCGGGCASIADNGRYYVCNGSSCTASIAAILDQVRNPVDGFAVNNNGVIIDLPAVPAQGATTVSGSMIFGIGTQSNNGLGNARVFDVNPNSGYFRTVAGTQTFVNSFLDTGSNGLFFPTGGAFPSAALPTCGSGSIAPEFFCPTSTQTFTPIIQAFSNGANVAVTFSIGNAVRLLNDNPSFHAYNNLGAPIPPAFANSFDWGLPFYFGRRVYTALSGESTPGGVGPYVAF